MGVEGTIDKKGGLVPSCKETIYVQIQNACSAKK